MSQVAVVGRLAHRDVDLHLAAPVPVASRCARDVLGHLARAEELAVELRRRDARDHGPLGTHALAVGQADGSRPPTGDEDPLDAGAGSHLATRVAHDPGERVDEDDSAPLRNRHPPELERAGDDLGHEPRRRLIRPEPRVEHPGREEAVGGVRLERLVEPVAAADERAAEEGEETAAAEPAERLATEAEARGGPELAAEDAERQVGVRHELVEHPLPGRTVTSCVAVQLGDVVFERRREERARAVGERSRSREVGVQVLDSAPVELVLQLGVGGRAGEEGVPRRKELVREAGLRQLGRRADAAAEHVLALEDAHAPARSGEERRSGERVDPGTHEDRVERRHRRARVPASVLA